MRSRLRRGVSVPILIAVGIILFFCGRHAYIKFQEHEWTQRVDPGISKTRAYLEEALKGATYPAFNRGSDVVPVRSSDKGLILFAKAFEQGDKLEATINATEGLREVAHFFHCKPRGQMCDVTLHRIYMDNGALYGHRQECVANLYLEKRNFEISQQMIGQWGKYLRDATGEHDRLVRSVARVRFSVPLNLAKAASPPLTFEILCRQPVDGGLHKLTKAEVGLHVSISYREQSGHKTMRK